MQIDVGVAAMMNQNQQRLWREAWRLLELSKAQTVPFTDYGFVIFPAAKVYEGYLKSFFYQMGMISRQAYYGEYFRIGKALNPDLPKRYRDETWVFDELTISCSEVIARKLWDAWKVGRNQVFHYQIGDGEGLSLAEAEKRLTIISEAMKAASVCEVRVKRGDRE